MKKIKILAVASGGGHWMQLMRIQTVLDRYDVHYLTTIKGLPEEADVENYEIIPDTSRDNIFSAFLCVWSVFKAMIKVRPSVVITTGAAPGLIAIILGRIFFAKTLWIDSVANGDELSMSGKISKKFSSVTISQWREVAKKESVGYWGRVL